MKSKYKTFWAILAPTKGIARKEDVVKLNTVAMRSRSEIITVYSRSKTTLLDKLLKCTGELKKAYTVTIITDKQFGMMEDYNYAEVATFKQLSDSFIIN